ncbi:MAG: MarR family transcriptional regulator [Ilumatobacteraceae bacterium]|nr:MarR family transcriptional regulator [Ilumatobacteraceae bacterium]
MEPNWLSEEEEKAWRGFVALRIGLVGHLARQLAQDSGITEAEFEVLVVVSEASGQRIRSRDLGKALNWERSRLSHQITRMEERGMVAREQCENDARGFDVVLTKAGLKAIQAAAPKHLEAVRHCFIDLLSPAQMKTLTNISELVAEHLKEEHAQEE